MLSRILIQRELITAPPNNAAVKGNTDNSDLPKVLPLFFFSKCCLSILKKERIVISSRVGAITWGFWVYTSFFSVVSLLLYILL